MTNNNEQKTSLQVLTKVMKEREKNSMIKQKAPLKKKMEKLRELHFFSMFIAVLHYFIFSLL